MEFGALAETIARQHGVEHLSKGERLHHVLREVISNMGRKAFLPP